MRTNGPLALLFHALFICFIAAPLVTVILVSFTDKGYMSMPFNGASLRWYRALLEAPEFAQSLRTSLVLGVVSASVSLLLHCLRRWLWRVFISSGAMPSVLP